MVRPEPEMGRAVRNPPREQRDENRCQVKNYYMVMDSYDGEVLGHVEGNWTGNVKTNDKNSYITLPFQVIYKVSPRWI